MLHRTRAYAVACVLLLVVACTRGGSATPVDPPRAAAGTVRNKIGFHLGPGGNQDHIQTYMDELDAAGRCGRLV